MLSATSDIEDEVQRLDILGFSLFSSFSISTILFLFLCEDSSYFGVGVQRKKAYHHGAKKRTAMGTAQFAILPCFGKFSLDPLGVFTSGFYLDCSIPLVAAQPQLTALHVGDTKTGGTRPQHPRYVVFASRLRRWSLLHLG